jgi:Protein of unknown function (DUF2568)
VRRSDAISLVVRVALECAIVAAFAYWGVHTGRGAGAKAAYGVGAPVAAFGFWGAVDFRRLGRFAEPLRLVQELAVSGLAALALYAVGVHALGLALAALSLAYHALVYATGARLLKPDQASV